MPDLDQQLRTMIEGALKPLDLDAIVARRRAARRRRRLGSALAAACAVVAIGAATTFALSSHTHDRPGAVRIAPQASSTSPATDGPQRYEIVTRVEEDRTHAPELCILAVADVARRDTSDCAGPRITNWDWKKAPDPQRANGETFGEYRLVGTYDGNAFTLTQGPEVGRPPSTQNPAEPAPCPTPPGGWHSTSTDHLGLTDFEALQAAAQGAPDFAGLWMSSSSTTAPINDFQHSQVTVVAYTGNLTEHRSQLAALWGGPVCVVQHPHSAAELDAIVSRINAHTLDDLGLQLVTLDNDEVNDVVQLQVVAATAATQRAVDRRFGPGLVKVTSLLNPIP